MRLTFRAVVALALLVLTASLFAGETGSVSGVVRDSGGTALPAVAVRVSGPAMPGGRQTVTAASGSFQFQKLLPGPYRVEAELTGLGKAAQAVSISVDVDVQISLTLQPRATAELVVTAAEAAVDLRSAEVGSNFGEKELRALPLPRSYAGAFQLIPGASTDPNYFGFNAGGTQQDNLFLIDGVNITNPGFGYLSIETNELDIAEFNVKKGGINAELRAVGAVVNAVTKSGTNAVAGAVRVEAQPDSFSARSVNPAVASTTDRYVTALSLGFPILRDTVFGYVSGRYRIDDTTDRANSYGALPDGTFREQEYHGKLTAFPSEKHYVSVDGRVIPQKSENGFDSLQDQATRGYEVDNTQSTVSATWAWFTTSSTNVEAKVIHLTEENRTRAQNGIGATPAWNPTNIYRNGSFADPVGGGTGGVYPLRSNDQNYARDEVRLAASQYLDLGPTRHHVKVGAGYETGEEELTRLANGWGDISASTSVIDGRRAAYRARWYPDQSTQLSLSRTYTFFLQDTITWKRLSATVGFMVNRDEYAQEIAGNRNNFLTFRFGEQVQPRVGVVYNAELLKGDKLYASYGKYMDLNQKSSARSLAPARIYQLESFFDAGGALLGTFPRASTTGKTIDGGLKPTYLEAIAAGYSAPIAGRWSFDVNGEYKVTRHFIEDVPGTYPQAGPFHAANLDDVGASRSYRALTLEVQRRYADGWALQASYTLSRFEGNFDLDYGGAVALFNTSSSLQDGQGWYVNDPNRFGLLSTDRPHILKLFGSCDVLGIQLGGALRVQSGRAYEARGMDGLAGFNRYLEPAGSRRNPTWTSFDLLAAYRIPVGMFNLRLEGRILNVFDTQTVLAVNRTQYLDPFVANGTGPLYAEPQRTTQPNRTFEAPTSYAPARRFILSVTADF